MRDMSHFDIPDDASIDPSVVFGPHCRNVRIGHGARIGRDVYIDVDTLDVGDYVTIHHGTVVHGETVRIGHNCWIGHYCILDGHGGLLSIGNNVGIGAQSQLWSHMKFGDVLAGCRWNRMEQLVIEDDVWLVGHCIVTPITAHRRSMLLVGGVATKDMLENHTYAGSPAKDVTAALGPQFDEPSPEAILEGFARLVGDFHAEGHDAGFIEVSTDAVLRASAPGKTVFAPLARSYVPTYSAEEMSFMRFLLYDRAKFLPLTAGS